jgi:hypothetical protein
VRGEHAHGLLLAQAHDLGHVAELEARQVPDLGLDQHRVAVGVHVQEVLDDHLLRDLEGAVQRADDAVLVVGRLEGRLDRQVHGQDQVRAERLREAQRQRVDDAAVHVVVRVALVGLEDAGQAAGRVHGVHDGDVRLPGRAQNASAPVSRHTALQ